MTNNLEHQLQVAAEGVAYFQSIFDNALYGIATTVGTDFIFARVNDAFCRLLEYERDELVGVRSIADVTSPDDFPRNKQLLSQLVNNEIQRFQIEKQYMTKSGRCLDVVVYVLGFYDNDGKYIGSTGSLIDITERKKMERELKNSEQKYRNLVDNSLVGVFSSTLDGRFIFVNDALAKMYDFDSPILMMAQETLARWTDLKQRERLVTILQKHGSVTDFEMESITESGRHIHVLLSVKLLGDTIYGVARDITENKELLDKLSARKKDLQDLAGRLLSIQEEERRRLARELHDDLAQRLAVMAIEAGQVDTGGDNSESVVILKLLQDKLISVSEDVHRISRQLHPSIIEDLGLEEALKSEIHNFSRLEQIPVQLEYDIGSTDLSLDVSVSLFRVTQESLRNIQKHANAKSVTIQLVRENNLLILTIKDDGRGFAPDRVKNMSGLGLKSMRERIRLINGSISYISLPGQGATVQARVDTSK